MISNLAVTYSSNIQIVTFPMATISTSSSWASSLAAENLKGTAPDLVMASKRSKASVFIPQIAGEAC